MRIKLISLFCVVSFLMLCGCSGYREADNGYIVTAIGFDGNEDFKVSVEVVTAGGSELRSEPKSEVISGKGNSPMEAVFSLNSKISKNLVFDHCTALLIGKNLSGKNLEEVLKYGKEIKELNFAIDMFMCESAEDLLKESESVSVARGFDIAANLKETKSETGIDYQNKFYEIYMEYNAGKSYSFPYLKVKNERIIIDGESVFKENKEKAHLTNEEALLYSFIKNDNNGGRIFLGEEFAEITHSHCSKNKDDGYTVNLSIKQKSKKFPKIFKKRIEKMLEKHKDELNFSSDKIKLKERDGI